MREVMSSLEYNLTPVALTGVEDCLQDQVCSFILFYLFIFLFIYLFFGLTTKKGL